MEASILNKVLDLAVKIQQIPAPTFEESARAAFLQDVFLTERLKNVSIDPLGNVYGCIKGRGESNCLVVSAHSDTVFPTGTDLSVGFKADSIHGPGIGDNSLGVAGLLGLVWTLRQTGQLKNLPGDLWLVANVGEEGLGDLRGMRAIVDRFGKNTLAYLVIEGMALGQIYHRALGVQRYKICVRTPGGHSWVDYGQPSAIHELARLITRLTMWSLPEKPRTTLNVGVITGGTSVNTIAAEASLELDLRSEEVQSLSDLIRKVENEVHTLNRDKVSVEWELIGLRPSGKIPVTHPLVSLAQKSLEKQGIRPNLTIGSTDANIPLSRGYPSVCVGLTKGGGAHTIHEYINTQPLDAGLAQLATLVGEIYRELGG